MIVSNEDQYVTSNALDNYIVRQFVLELDVVVFKESIHEIGLTERSYFISMAILLRNETLLGTHHVEPEGTR